jgi:hypothetical protein
MLVRQIRQLLLIKSKADEKTLGFSPWQMGKLRRFSQLNQEQQPRSLVFLTHILTLPQQASLLDQFLVAESHKEFMGITV